MLAANRVMRRAGGGAKSPSLLAGFLYDGGGERRWCMNRLDPSGELRAGFGEAYQAAADKPPISNRIIRLRERFYPRTLFGQRATGMVWACFEVRLTIHAPKPCPAPELRVTIAENRAVVAR